MHATEKLRLQVSAGYGWLTQDIADTAIPGAADGSLTIDTRDIRLKGRYGISRACAVAADAAFRDFAVDTDSEEVAYGLEAQLRLGAPFGVSFRFEHDQAPSVLAVRDDITYDSPTAYLVLRPTDRWDITASGVRYDFSDGNTRDHLRLGTSWVLSRRTGLNVGVFYAYGSAEEASDAYWTPYELERIYAEIGFRGNTLRSMYNVRLRAGSGGEEVRPEDMAAYQAAVASAQAGGYDPFISEPRERDETIVGGVLSLRFPVGRHVRFLIDASYNRLPNYNQLDSTGAVEWVF